MPSPLARGAISGEGLSPVRASAAHLPPGARCNPWTVIQLDPDYDADNRSFVRGMTSSASGVRAGQVTHGCPILLRPRGASKGYSAQASLDCPRLPQPRIRTAAWLPAPRHATPSRRQASCGESKKRRGADAWSEVTCLSADTRCPAKVVPPSQANFPSCRW